MAKVTVQELVAKFTGDTKGLEGALGRAKTAIGSATRAITAGLGISAASLTAFGLATMKAVGEQDDLAKSLGLSYKELSKLNVLAKEGGTSMQAVGNAIGMMQKNLVEAASGSESALYPFQQLGISVENLLNLSPEQQFSAIATEISKIENPAQRTAIAMDLFGRSGRDLIQILSDYGLKSKEAEEFTRRFGLSLSQIEVEKISSAEDAIGRVGLAISGASSKVMVELSPAIQLAANEVLGMMSNTEALVWATEKLSDAFVFLADLARKAYQVLTTLFSGVIAFVQSALAGIWDMFSSIEKGMNSLAEKIPFIGDKISKTNIFGGIAEQQKRAAKVSIGVLKEEADALLNSQTLLQKLQQYRTKQYTRTESTNVQTSKVTSPYLSTEQTEKMADGIKNVTSETNKATDAFEGMGKEIDRSFDSFVDSVVRGEDALTSLKKVAFDVLKSIIDGVFQTSNGANGGGGIGSAIASSIGSIFQSSTAGSAGASGIFGSIGKIFGFAKGGVISGANMFPIGGNMGMMGEKGAEAIMPLTRGGDGKLGVAAHGGGGKQIVQNINISTGVQQTVRAELLRMLPMIQQSSVSAVQDSNRRGA